MDSALIQIQEAGHALITQPARRFRRVALGRNRPSHERVARAGAQIAGGAGGFTRALARFAKSTGAIAARHGFGRAAIGRQNAYAAFEQHALKLRQARQKAAKQLAKAVTASMQTLNMTGGRFDIAITDAAPSAFGMDAIEFQVAGHAGVALQALHKVASGGELARISLALSVITSAVNPVPTLILTKWIRVLAAQSPRSSGKRLHKLAGSRQVLCVTHLPQVAAQGDAPLARLESHGERCDAFDHRCAG